MTKKLSKETKIPKKMGRPSSYNEKIADEICQEIATSVKGLHRLCSENEHWPEAKTVYKWCYDNLDFLLRYHRAKSQQVEWMVEHAIEIAHDGTQDTYLDIAKNERLDHEWVARSKLRVDTIKWLAARLAPKIYGDRIQTELTINVDNLTPEQLDKLIEKLPLDQQVKLVEKIVQHHDIKDSKK